MIFKASKNKDSKYLHLAVKGKWVNLWNQPDSKITHLYSTDLHGTGKGHLGIIEDERIYSLVKKNIAKNAPISKVTENQIFFEIPNEKITTTKQSSGCLRVLLIIFIFILSSFCFAQEAHNFKIDNGTLVYEKIFNDSTSITEVKKILKNYSGSLEDLDNENELFFAFENHQIPYKKYGGSVLGTAYFAQNPFFASMIIELKKGRFKITVANFVSNEINKTAILGTEVKTPFEQYVLKKNTAFKKGKSITKGLAYYDQFFTELFQKTQKNNDW